MIQHNHALAQEQALAFAAHVEEHPDLVQMPEQTDDTRLDNLRTARAAKHTASVLRHSHESSYQEWLEADPIGSATEALLTSEPLAPTKEILPVTILGVEKDKARCRTERLRLLWQSGQSSGLGQAGIALLNSWDERRQRLNVQQIDVFNGLRRNYNHLEPEAATKATRQAAEQKGRLIMIQASKEAKRDGIIHLNSTDTMAEKLMPLVGAGKHILLMGPRGTAKSAMSRYVAKTSMDFAGSTGNIIESTIKPDTPASELIGRWVMTSGTMHFIPGPVMQGIIEDKPVLIEEFNNADHDVQSGLQRIMLLSPGESITFQQGDATISYTRGKNFCVIANANVKGANHKRYDIDPAMRERFTGGIHEVSYPDAAVKLDQTPLETLQLLETFLTDKSGLVAEPNAKWEARDIDTLAKIAHWTQYLATHPASNVEHPALSALLDQNNFGTLKPVLSEVVIGPRAMLEMASWAQADPSLTLADVLVRFADAPDMRAHSKDRRLLADLMFQLHVINRDDFPGRLHLPISTPPTPPPSTSNPVGS